MKKTLLFVAIALIGFTSCAQKKTAESNQNTTKTEVTVDPSQIISLYFDDDLMREAKKAIEAGDPAIMPLFNSFKKNTDAKYLNMKPVSIVEGKKRTAPSRDPRDYISLSPYWWPDPDSDTGIPYVRNDGVRNPEVYDFVERTIGGTMGDATQSLAMMYYFTGDEKYAAKAADFLREWFLDPVTGMNPNLTFAQYVPGMERIRGTGVMEARTVSSGLNAAQIISSSKSWTAEDEAALKDWAIAFRYWIENSSHGQAEAMSQNNHGLWYEAYREAVTMYTGDYTRLRDMIVADQLPRLPKQIAKDSTMPHEIARTLGLHYTTFSLSAVNRTNIMAKKIGVPVWDYTGANGRNMSWGIDYVIPYWKEPSKWPHMQIKPISTSSAAVVLYHVGKELNNQAYSDLAMEFGLPAPRGAAGVTDILYYKMIK
ncbi:MAG: alginate lyase family protein [Rikenellaceae bacterium]